MSGEQKLFAELTQKRRLTLLHREVPDFVFPKLKITNTYYYIIYFGPALWKAVRPFAFGGTSQEARRDPWPPVVSSRST